MLNIHNMYRWNGNSYNILKTYFEVRWNLNICADFLLNENVILFEFL